MICRVYTVAFGAPVGIMTDREKCLKDNIVFIEDVSTITEVYNTIQPTRFMREKIQHLKTMKDVELYCDRLKGSDQDNIGLVSFNPCFCGGRGIEAMHMVIAAKKHGPMAMTITAHSLSGTSFREGVAALKTMESFKTL